MYYILDFVCFLSFLVFITSSTNTAPAIAQIWAAMDKIRKKYLVAFIRMDQAHLGDPVLRRRVYIILVRRPGCARKKSNNH